MAKEKNAERDAAICRAYTDEGLTMRECGKRFGLSRTRIADVLKEQKVSVRPRQLRVKTTEDRDEFLGVFVTEDEKKWAVEEAEKEGGSISSVIRKMIKERREQSEAPAQ